jgi:Skp family chaperone for outer membrane proteins
MKTLIPALTLAATALLFTAQDARSQAKPEPRPPKIAVIDMARIYSDSLLGKSFTARIDALRNEIEADRTKKQSDLTKMDAAIKALQDDIEKQQSVLSPEALERKRQDLIKKNRDRQAYLEDGQQDLQRMQERAQQQAQTLQNEFQVKIKPHVDAVAKEKGLDILLDSGSAMTMNKDFDISQEVIVRADDAERAARKPAAAKPPAAAPAIAPAAPAPAPTPTPTPTPQPSSHR